MGRQPLSQGGSRIGWRRIPQILVALIVAVVCLGSPLFRPCWPGCTAAQELLAPDDPLAASPSPTLSPTLIPSLTPSPPTPSPSLEPIQPGSSATLLPDPSPPDLALPSPSPTLTPFPPSPPPTPLITPAPPFFSPPATGEPSPGSEVLVGGIPVLRLQTADYSSEVRAQVVGSVIEQFLRFRPDGSLPEPQVRWAQDNNLQYILQLGDKANFTATQQYLFTVTYADAAIARGVSSPKITDVRQVAELWARQLERAISDYRQVKLDEARAQNPWVVLLSTISAIALILIGYFVWRLSHRLLHYAQQWMEVKLGDNWRNWVDVGAVLCRVFLAISIAALTLHGAISSIPLLRVFQRIFYYNLGRFFQTAFGVLSQPFPNSNLTIASLALFLGLSIIIFILAHHLSLGLQQRFLMRLGLDINTQEATSTIFKYGFTLLGMLLVLPFSGINLSSLAVVAGAVGIGIGFGLQNLFNNYLSYVAILFERPIQIGDLVEVDSLLGTVERISPRATVIRTMDRVFVIVPNSRFTESKIVNWSYRDPRCRIHVPIGVAYGSNPEEVCEALLQVARENARVLSSPAPQVWLKGFGDSALNFDLLVWINRPQDQFLLVSELNFLIEAEFRRRGIHIPFPQQDLHIRSADAFQGMFNGRDPAHTASQSDPLPSSSVPPGLAPGSEGSPDPGSQA
ncbi:MAG: mechanosensitive ion channel [Cyanobacteriota bacterium]|nr:mechanosensitive ion channel [Cyanobacteriota bacterium]